MIALILHVNCRDILALSNWVREKITISFGEKLSLASPSIEAHEPKAK
jgi:hypothetical protein